MLKKRTVLIMLLLCSLFANGIAEAMYSVTEVYEQAQAGWQKTYATLAGEINIDVTPIVPDVEHLPVYRTSYARPAPSCSEAESGFSYWTDEYDQAFSFEYDPPYEKHQKQIKSQSQKLTMTDHAFGDYDLDHPYAQNNPLTLRDIKQEITEKLASLGFDASDFDLDRPAQLIAYVMLDAQKAPVDSGFLVVDYFQTLCGVPVLCHAAQAFENPEMPQYVPALGGQIASGDSFDLFLSTLKAEDTLAEDIPLCSFSTVIQGLEQLITDGHLRKVFDMQLGYVLFTDPNYSGGGENITVDHYFAKPMWVVKGIYINDPNEAYIADEGIERFGRYAATLLIDAQSGNVIEYRGKADNKRAVWNGYIPWDGQNAQ